MARALTLHPDRVFPADPATRSTVKALYAEVATLPIVSRHGHTDPTRFAENASRIDAMSLRLTPGNCVYQMVYSKGVGLDVLAIPSDDDRRAFCSIPARHDVARQIDCGVLARLVAEHRLAGWEAVELAHKLTSGLVRRTYRIDEPFSVAQAA